MQVENNNIDVLVVGAGPVGLCLAVNLLRQGLNVRIVEKNEQPCARHVSKALGLYWRSVEILDDMGCADELMPHAIATNARTVKINGTVVSNASHPPNATRFPSMLTTGQSVTEWTLREQFTKLGGKVEFGVELVDFKNEEDFVSITLRHRVDAEHEVPEELRAKYIVGCDGAHSTVRHKLNISFHGTQFQENLILGDFDIEWNGANDRLNMNLTDDFLLAIVPFPYEGEVPMRIHYRIVVNELKKPFTDSIQGPSEQKPAHGVLSEGAPDMELFQKYLQQVYPDAKLSNPTWLTAFRISNRLVNTFRVGRVFLAGDSAHIHSPIGGQGMNTGLADAYNLAWKLGLVLKNMSPSSLLDSYHSERYPVAETVLTMTSRLTNMIFTKSPILKTLRNQIVSIVGSFSSSLNFLAMSQLDMITYPVSSIIKDENASFWSRETKAGQRAVDVLLSSGNRFIKYLHGYKHTALLFCGKKQFSKSFDQAERIALQLQNRYSNQQNKEESPLKIFIVIPHGCSQTYQGDLIQDNEKNELYTVYGIGDETEVYIVRPDRYVAYHSQPADGDKILQYLKLILTCGNQ